MREVGAAVIGTLAGLISAVIATRFVEVVFVPEEAGPTERDAIAVIVLVVVGIAASLYCVRWLLERSDRR